MNESELLDDAMPKHLERPYMGENIKLDPPPRPYRLPIPKPIGETAFGLVAKSTGNSKNPQFVRLMLYWPLIVGGELATKAKPVKMIGTHKSTAPTITPKYSEESQYHVSRINRSFILVLSAPSHYRLEVEYAVPTIIERINGWAGKYFISKIKVAARKAS